MRKGGRTLGVSRGGGGGGGGGSGGGGGGGGSGPTEGGEDRDTKGFDVQPFHRLYFSAPFYPSAVRSLATPRITPYILLILQRAPKAAIARVVTWRRDRSFRLRSFHYGWCVHYALERLMFSYQSYFIVFFNNFQLD
jgi:hypothetical protein